jgi:tetratricopeptide (TPR) repeat protein
MRRGQPAALVVAGMACAAALAAFAPGAARAQDGAPEQTRPLLAVPRHDHADEPSALPLPDEQKIERARNLVRMGYTAEAQKLVDDVALRHADDLDVLLARVDLLTRARTGDDVLKFMTGAGARGAVQKQLATRPRRAGVWQRFRAEALFSLGRPGEGARAALAAWEASAEQASWARVRLADAGTADANARESMSGDLRHAADRHPDRQDLALAAAQDEAHAGKVHAALKRLARVDEVGVSPMGVVGSADTRRGATLWQFGLAMLERGEGDAPLADSAFAAIALDPAADPELKRQATDRLFEGGGLAEVSEIARGLSSGALTLGGPGAFQPPGGTRTPGTTTSQLVRLHVDDQGRLVTDDAPAPTRGAGAVGGATGGTAGPAGSLASLERIWRGLPPSRETVRRGLDLAERMRGAGDAAGAGRVEDAAASMARALPGAGGAAAGEATGEDSELSGRLALREGDAALATGDLAKAADAYGRAAHSNASDPIREEARFEACETEFFAGRFDSAAAAYDRFARDYPSGRFTNDALERAYLVESGDGGPVRGLPELATALRVARMGSGDDALAAATAAEQAAADGPAFAHAELLLADLLVARGRTPEALAKVVHLAETRPDDRLAPTARKRAGDLYRAQGQDALALAQYDALLLKYPRSWLAPETRRAANEVRAKTGGTP